MYLLSRREWTSRRLGKINKSNNKQFCNLITEVIVMKFYIITIQVLHHHNTTEKHCQFSIRHFYHALVMCACSQFISGWSANMGSFVLLWQCSLVLRSPLLLPFVCVHNNTRKWKQKTSKKQGRPGSIHDRVIVSWTREWRANIQICTY